MTKILDRLPDVAGLRAALAIRDEGTVTRAAERLRLTQPSVSRLLATLEAEVGFPIFERRRRRLVLDERGRLLLAEAEAALAALSRLSDVGRELRQGHRGLLRIAAIPSVAHYLLPPAIARFKKEAPGVVLEIREMLREAQLAALQAGTVDITFASLPVGAAGIRIEAVAEADAVCLMPAGHRLAGRDVIGIGDLSGEPLIAGHDASTLRRRTDDLFAHAGHAPSIAVISDGASLAAALVSAGLGLAVTHAVPGWTLPPGLVARRLRPSMTFAYAALLDGRAPPGDLTAMFVASVRRAARNLAPYRPAR